MSGRGFDPIDRGGGLPHVLMDYALTRLYHYIFEDPRSILYRGKKIFFHLL
jgi:hypothetical protein